jgi:hypothetical protein
MTDMLLTVSASAKVLLDLIHEGLVLSLKKKEYYDEFLHDSF